MDKSAFETKLLNQGKMASAILSQGCLPRFAARQINFDAPLLLIRGVRGAGKTFTALHALAKTGKRFAYIDLSLLPMISPDMAFADIYESLIMAYGPFEAVVIDECANFGPIEKIFKGFADCGISVVGIYSGMKTLPLAQADTPIINLYPLSFSEYCLWHNVDTASKTPENTAALRMAFNDYASRGGFPEMQNKQRFTRTRSALENAIIENDLKGSFRKDKVQELKNTAKMLLGHSSELVNYKRIAENLGIGSEITAKKYVEAIKECGFLFSMARFGQIYMQRTTLEKLYAADPAFIPDGELQKKLEAIVYMQLRRFCEKHEFKMHYYANRASECNFAVCANRKMRIIIQVIADYSDSQLIKEKIKALIAMSNATGCNRLFILTDSSSDTIATKDLVVTVVPVYEFLLGILPKIIVE